MKTSHFALLTLLSASFLSCKNNEASSKQKSNIAKPNIIYILADD